MDYPTAARNYIQMRASDGDVDRHQIPYNAMLEGRGLEIIFPGGLEINGMLFAGPRGEDFKSILQSWGLRPIYPDYAASWTGVSTDNTFDATKPPSIITTNFTSFQLPLSYNSTQTLQAMTDIFRSRMPPCKLMPEEILATCVALTKIGWILMPIGTAALGFFQATPAWLKDPETAAKWDKVKALFQPITNQFMAGQYSVAVIQVQNAAFDVAFWDGVAAVDIFVRDAATLISQKGAQATQDYIARLWANLPKATKVAIIGAGALTFYAMVIRPITRR